MLEKGKIGILLLLLAITGNGWSQSIPWTVQATGANHTLFINTSANPKFNGQPLETGDAIGVFYDSVGTLACAGVLEWPQSNSYITAYGVFAGAKGLATGETFKFKLWKKTLNCIVDSVKVSFAAQDGALVTADSQYVEGGLSEITAFEGFQAAITYPKVKYCQNEPKTLPIVSGKLSKLSFSGSPNLSIDPVTGAIDFAKSTVGNHTIYFQSTTCVISATYSLVITAVPQVKLGNDTLLCVSSSLTLDAQNTGSTYLWSTGAQSQSIQVRGSGSYSVKVSSADLCTGIDTIQIQSYQLDLSKLKPQLINADCKNQGQILIDETSIEQGLKPYEYTLTNLHTQSSIKSTSTMMHVNDGAYQLSIKDKNGCAMAYSGAIEISRTDDCNYPILAPNSTGALATIFIPHAGIAKIYDKNGVLQKQLSVPAHWDGTDENGHQVKMGDYYIICDDHENIIVTVIR